MESRRDFIKKATLLSGMGAVAGMLPPSIQRAFSIDPAAGSTYLDAEHVVILMQENRSFDHCYGALRGVRGFNDPRAITLPDEKPVWCQTNEKGETFGPFRLNIKDTKATWMGSLPHSWTDQVDARNNGRYDQWLIAKKAGREDYKDLPLTLGYYTREDLPFYYSLADAFTICDQNFCSSLTGTTPNRLYLWTGKIRENENAPARVRNEETDYGVEAQWKTFPEKLEENGISWKIYQNEISVGAGFAGEEDSWLGNFTDNPIEWFSQYHVRLHAAYIQYLPSRIASLKTQLQADEDMLKTLNEGSPEYNVLNARITRVQKELESANRDFATCTKEAFDRLSAVEKNLHSRAFVTNQNDPAYHELEIVTYKDGETTRQMKVPKGDVLHQFRDDVKQGKLPTVSWLVAPENFSDHPGAPWYGAWYLSESLDILTQNPEVWKKTIFILCYDENDGYFDHVPPFVPPAPGRPETGLVSASIDIHMEHVSVEQDLKRKPADEARGSSIGLGYRVPLVIASPWSRGGNVCSQVFDHTSIIMFLEKFLSKKTGKRIEESNISSWRRTICGDLTSAFKPYNGEPIGLPAFVQKDEFIESIHKAQFLQMPTPPAPLSRLEIESVRDGLTLQENGSRPSLPLPYELYASMQLLHDSVAISLKAGTDAFREKSAGSPFHVYAFGTQWMYRSYAVKAGDTLKDTWPLTVFESDLYHIRVDGPNGFYREFRGGPGQHCEMAIDYERKKDALTGNLLLKIRNLSGKVITVSVTDNAYAQSVIQKKIAVNNEVIVKLKLQNSHGWYDASITVTELPDFEMHFAGKVETGKESVSDPQLG